MDLSDPVVRVVIGFIIGLVFAYCFWYLWYEYFNP